MRNLQEQVKKAFYYQKLFRTFTVRTNCSCDLKIFANSRPSASNFKTLSRSLEQFFLTIGQNNFCNKIPILTVQQIWHSTLILNKRAKKTVDMFNSQIMSKNNSI